MRYLLLLFALLGVPAFAQQCTPMPNPFAPGQLTCKPSGGGVSVQQSGSSLGTASTFNFGSGFNATLAGSTASIPLDWTKVQAVNYCAGSSGSGTAYVVTCTPTIAPLAANTFIRWKPDVNGSGGATTITIDANASVPVKLADGTTNPASSTIVAGQVVNLWYDGTVARVTNGASVTTNGTNGQGLTSNGAGGFGTPVTLAASATTDTTNAANISSGTLPAGRLPSLFATAGTGDFWPFGVPRSASAITYSGMSASCTTNCPVLFQEFSAPGTFTFSKFVFREGGTADSGKVAAMALFNSAGTLVASCSAGQSLTSTNTVLTCPLDSSATYTVTPGTYFLAFVASSSTASFFTDINNSNTLALYNADTTPRNFFVTTGTSLSGSTFTWAASIGTRATANAGSLPATVMFP